MLPDLLRQVHRAISFVFGSCTLWYLPEYTSTTSQHFTGISTAASLSSAKANMANISGSSSCSWHVPDVVPASRELQHLPLEMPRSYWRCVSAFTARSRSRPENFFGSVPASAVRGVLRLRCKCEAAWMPIVVDSLTLT